jgi:acetyltransferase-like isoleucine patch superfamily enzyme
MQGDRHPIPIEPPTSADPWRRAAAFFGHYDCRVFVSDRAYVDVGGGSFLAARNVQLVPNWAAGCIGTIGRYVEAAECRIFVSAEHANDRVVNVLFGSAPTLLAIAESQGVQDYRSLAAAPFRIGNAALLSCDATLLPGSEVGDGAVVGANALVNRPVEAFTIAAGTPARVLRARFDAERTALIRRVRWWDFATSYLIGNIPRLEQLSVTETPHVYRTERPRFVFRTRTDAGLDLIGFDDGTLRPIATAPAAVLAYAQQAFGSGPNHWLSDVWSED